MNADLRSQGLNDPFPQRSGVQSVNVVDEFTAQMVLSAPNIVLPVFVTFVYMLEPGYYTETSIQETALSPVGTGPYRVTEWVTGDHLTLERYDDYWRGKPPVPTVIMKPIPERATRLNLLLTGEADIVGDLTPDDFPTVEGNDNLRVSQTPGSRRMHIGVPANVARYSDRRVRKALQMAVDFEGITEALLGPMAPEERRPSVLCASASWGNPDIPLIEYDPDTAKSELEAAGFPFDEKIKVITPQGRYLKDTEVAQAVAGNFRDIDLDAEVEVLEWTVYVDRMGSDTGLGDIYLLGLGSRLYGPEDVSIVTTDQVFDQTGWIDSTENGPKFKDMYATLTGTFDVDEQHKIVAEMDMLFHDEFVWMPLWIQPGATAVNKRLTFEDSGGGNRFTFWLPDEDPVRVTG
jgi:peptide/nickel transport system substrate-binding protein